MLKKLKEAVYEANLDLVEHGLVCLTWGNVSAIDRGKGLVVIKPSGVPYSKLQASDMVVVDLEGKVVDGGLRPSSDTPTHVALYRAWDSIGGIVHTHSPVATSFAQACREIPCLGTTHADHFHGPVRVAPVLTAEQVADAYEANTAVSIIQTMGQTPPLHVPGILTAHHGPFAWGKDASGAVEHAVILEAVARMALDTYRLNPAIGPIPDYLSEKHFERKHGENAYYGQHV